MGLCSLQGELHREKVVLFNDSVFLHATHHILDLTTQHFPRGLLLLICCADESISGDPFSRSDLGCFLSCVYDLKTGFLQFFFGLVTFFFFSRKTKNNNNKTFACVKLGNLNFFSQDIIFLMCETK